MAVTHADLAISRRGTALGSKLPTCVFLLCALLGLLAFVFGFVAEITRTEIIWIELEDRGMKCMYSNDGWSPLVSALSSILSLGMAVGVGQAYLWLVLCTANENDQFRLLTAWTEFDSRNYILLRWLAAGSFLISWICFGFAAVLLAVGIVVEAGHIERWGVPRDDCRAVREGVFAAAGVLGLVSSSMGVAFYICAVQTERSLQEEARIRTEVLEATADYTPAFPEQSMEELPQSQPK
ncbi:hypothetical protein SUGI_0115020 [Cryptomeria japonica]|uniref:uncharacterized protein LOC131054266 n=1 Tax=Cryptomeria japonica TaxID=3369 RepID=UPI002408EF7E|nr:uncharacterized protein LOC131054266 [Cryptomeria japonica]GLJ09739.1 hypothetical protein SUGI_0115020 [Cryptomeria japonica]